MRTSFVAAVPASGGVSSRSASCSSSFLAALGSRGLQGPQSRGGPHRPRRTFACEDKQPRVFAYGRDSTGNTQTRHNEPPAPVDFSFELEKPAEAADEEARKERASANASDAVAVGEPEAEARSAFWINRVLVSSLVRLIDTVYGSRPYARFYCLETVARVPYFSYLSVLHLYESIGLWRSADWLKVHFAQSWNEMHHLLIMESLGGNDRWLDRFIAGHAAVVYYWITTAMYVLHPEAAYNFAELVEAHAVESYSHFLEEHGEGLRGQPAPAVALEYYNARGAEAFLFGAFQTGAEGRTPAVADLRDVFEEIRRDEENHRDTLIECQKAHVGRRS